MVLLILLLAVVPCLASPDGRLIKPENYSLFYRPLEDQAELMDVHVGIVITQIGRVSIFELTENKKLFSQHNL